MNILQFLRSLFPKKQDSQQQRYPTKATAPRYTPNSPTRSAKAPQKKRTSESGDSGFSGFDSDDGDD